jgi:hypothetical protein
LGVICGVFFDFSLIFLVCCDSLLLDDFGFLFGFLWIFLVCYCYSLLLDDFGFIFGFYLQLLENYQKITRKLLEIACNLLGFLFGFYLQLLEITRKNLQSTLANDKNDIK